MMRPTTRHAVAPDGTRIAWHTHQEDPRPFPLVVLTNGLSTTPAFFRHIVPRLVPLFRVVHWDYRGHGESDAPANEDYSVRAHAADLVRVTEAALAEGGGEGGAVHVAFSMGVTVVLEAFRARPSTVRAMILVAGGADSPHASTRLFKVPGVRSAVRGALRALAPLVPEHSRVAARVSASRMLFPMAQRLGALGRGAPREELETYFRAVGAMNLRAYWNSVIGLLDARASDVLPTVQVPVLVIAPEQDVLAAPADLAALHRAIPAASWLHCPGTSHALLLEAGPAIASHILDFARTAVQGPEPHATVAALGAASKGEPQ